MRPWKRRTARSWRPFVSWARDFVERSPRPLIYAKLIEALDGLGRGAEAAETKVQALRLFPDDPYVLRARSGPQAPGGVPPWVQAPPR
jgi:hypothetical protein